MIAARRLKTTLAALIVGTAALLVFASSALALNTHVFSTSFGTAGSGNGQLSSPQGVAVNSTSHDIYVADTGNARIEQFSSAGAFIRTFGSFTTPTFIAVDNSGGLSNGDVYVADTATNLVYKFDSSGNTIAAWGTGGQLDGSTATGGPFTAIAGIAVDTSGNLFVYDPNNQNWFEFAQDGTPGTTVPFNRGTLNNGIGVDAGGHFYKVVGAGNVEQYSSSGTDLGPVDSGGNDTGLAVDPSTTDIYVDDGGLIQHFAPSCDPSSGPCTVTDSFGSGHLSSAAGLAIDSSNGTLYAADSGNSRIAVFTGPVVIPDVTTNPASAIGRTTATLNGHLDPAGGGNTTDCHFDYTDDASFQSNGFTGAQTAPCAEGNVQSSATDVHADISGLTTETTYHFRLSVANSNGADSATEQSFTTVGAVSLSTGSATAVAKTTATLNGTLNPGGVSLSSCKFDYTDDATFESQGYTGASTVPCAQSLGAIGTGSADVPVSADISGLEAATRYHFRLEASNSFGTNAGQDEVFATEGLGFGFKSFSFKLLNQSGQPYTQAGGHPYELEADLSFNPSLLNSVLQNGVPYPDGRVKDITVSLPPGVLGDPTATPKCPDVDLIEGDCPPPTQIGVIHLETAGFTLPDLVPVYNAELPTGLPAQFGFNNSPVVSFIDSHVRSGTDYGIDSKLINIVATVPILGSKLHLWGVPEDPGHDPQRDCPGKLIELGCATPAQQVPFLTNATSCSGPQTVTAHADSWEEQGDFVSATDTLPGNTGCNQLQFTPSLEARPTTNVADSPTGLSVDLHMPQSNSANTLATSHLRKAVVTLPEGLVLNPSGANGLGSCSSADVGLTSAVGATPVTFTPAAASCPNASKIGTVEIDTPLLDHPVLGGVYVAKPFDNPFGSLLAIYIAANDSQSGVVVKLAGQVTPDPNTGRLVTTFDEAPQQPVSDFKLNFFGGATAALRTPSTCGNYSTTSSLTPWSAPDSGPPATPHDDYSISQGPNGSCATSPGGQPNSPSFDAGSVSPIAGAYSPFVMHLRRDDGSQQFASLTLSPPPGLIGRLAGTPPCTDTQIAQAESRSKPGGGATELADPSCPAASKVGTVTVAAGAGPSPYYTTGSVYLAGPYKGSPLSFVIITPATAGPYDLGAVVVRAAISLDPATAQITATSDPIPSILAGIPLDVRSIALSLDKPDFTLNGTSCNESAVTGSLVSTLSQTTSLSERFQLAECLDLPFKPKLSLRLKGKTNRASNPRLIATYKARPGEANLASAQVKLPKAAFLDQGHIRTICTRPDFAAHTCPAASVYGRASATSPLVDYTVSGNVYLRANPAHKLPDLVADLRGPDSQPIEVALAGKTDSVKGALRNTFEAVPDVPVDTFRLELFGGKRSLIELSSGFCANPHASVLLTAQSGKNYDTEPAVGAACPKFHKHHKPHHARLTGQ